MRGALASFLAFGIACACPIGANAQQAHPSAAAPAIGTSLRVFVRDAPEAVTGAHYTGTDSSGFSVFNPHRGADYRFDWATVDSVQVKRGVTSSRRPVWVGALLGGAVLGLAAAGSADEGEVIDPGAAIGLGFAAGALAGAAIGGIVRSATARTIWETIPRWGRQAP